MGLRRTLQHKLKIKNKNDLTARDLQKKKLSEHKYYEFKKIKRNYAIT